MLTVDYEEQQLLLAEEHLARVSAYISAYIMRQERIIFDLERGTPPIWRTSY